MADVITRLLPFHSYNEPGLNEQILEICLFFLPTESFFKPKKNSFFFVALQIWAAVLLILFKVIILVDTNYLRHMVHLSERKDRIEKRIRSILCNEAMVIF